MKIEIGTPMTLKHFFKTSVSFLTLSSFFASNMISTFAFATQSDVRLEERMRQKGYIHIDGQRFQSLNDLTSMPELAGKKVWLTMDRLAENQTLDLSHIAKLFVEGKELRFYKDVKVQNFKYKLEGDLAFGESNDAIVNFQILNGNLKGTSGSFDARFGKLSGHRARVTTTCQDIRIGEGIQLEGTPTSKSSDGYNLGYMAGGKTHFTVNIFNSSGLHPKQEHLLKMWHAGNYYKNNGSFFNFSQDLKLISAQSILLKGSHVTAVGNFNAEAQKTVELLYSKLWCFSNATIKAPHIKLYRATPERLGKFYVEYDHKINQMFDIKGHVQSIVTLKNGTTEAEFRCLFPNFFQTKDLGPSEKIIKRNNSGLVPKVFAMYRGHQRKQDANVVRYEDICHGGSNIFKDGVFPHYALTSDPTEIQISGHLDLVTPNLTLEGAHLLVGGNLLRDGVIIGDQTSTLMKQNLWKTIGADSFTGKRIVYGQTQIHHAPNLIISANLHLPMGQRFDVDADMRAESIEMSGGTGTIHNRSLQQHLRTDLGPYNLDLSEHISQKPESAIVAGQTAEGYFFSSMGDFSDLDIDYSQTLIVDHTGQVIAQDRLPDTLNNPLRNLPLTLALQELVGKKLQRIDSPLWENAGDMLAFLISHGSALKFRWNQGEIQNPLDGNHEYPFMYFKMAPDGNLTTLVHFPKGYASTYLTGSIEGRVIDIQTTDNAEFLDRMYVARAEAFFFSQQAVRFATSVHTRFSNNGGYRQFIQTKSGVETEGSLHITALGGVTFQGGYFDVGTTLNVLAAYYRNLCLPVQSLTKTKKHTTFKETQHSTFIKTDGEHKITILPQEINDGRPGVILQAPVFQNKNGMIIDLNGTNLEILSVIEHIFSQKIIHKKNFFYQKTGGSNHTKDTVVDGQYDMGAGEFEILNPGEIHVQHRYGHLSNAIEQALQQHNVTSLEPLQDKETHKKLKTRYSITPEFATLVGVAITIASAGLDGGLGGAALSSAFAAEGIAATAITAGVNAGVAQLISQGVGHMIEHQGNPFKTVQSLLDPKNLEELAKTMVLAALTAAGGEFLSNKLNLPEINIHNPEVAKVVERVTASLKNVALGMGKDLIAGEKLNQSMLNAAANLVQEIAATQIKEVGQNFALKDIHNQKLMRYALHGLAGAAAGKIAKNDPLSRSFGAVAGEICADIFKDQMKAEGKYNPHLPTFKADIEKYTTYSSSIAKGLAVLFHLDSEAASRSAAIAARENCYYIIPIGILALCVTDAYFDEIQNGTEVVLKAVENALNKNVEDAYLTLQEKRSLAQSILIFMDKSAVKVSGGYDLQGITKDVTGHINYVLDGVASMRSDGNGFAKQIAMNMHSPDRVQSFLEQSGRLTGIALGLSTALPGKRNPAKPGGNAAKKPGVKPQATPNQTVVNPKSQPKPPSKTGGRAPEFPSGKLSENNVPDAMKKWLGDGYKPLANGRYISQDGLRQVRYGQHETRPGITHHVHFESYNKPGGIVIENSVVEIIK